MYKSRNNPFVTQYTAVSFYSVDPDLPELCTNFCLLPKRSECANKIAVDSNSEPHRLGNVTPHLKEINKTHFVCFT